MANLLRFFPPIKHFIEEEIDVVSLGEVLRMNPSAAAAAMTATTGKSLSAGNVASPTNTTAVSHAPLRLKLKGRSSLDCHYLIFF